MMVRDPSETWQARLDLRTVTGRLVEARPLLWIFLCQFCDHDHQPLHCGGCRSRKRNRDTLVRRLSSGRAWPDKLDRPGVILYLSCDSPASMRTSSPFCCCCRTSVTKSGRSCRFGRIVSGLPNEPAYGHLRRYITLSILPKFRKLSGPAN